MILRVLILWLQWGIYALLSRGLEDRYAYEGIEFEAPDLTTVVGLLCLLVVPAAVLRSAVRRPADIALWFLASFVVVPTLVVASVNPTVTARVGWTAGAAALLGLLVVAAVSRWGGTPTGINLTSGMTRGGFVAIVAAMSLLAIATIVMGYGITSFDLSIGDEYVRRLAAAEAPVPYLGANYVIAWYKAVLIPLAFILAAVWRLPAMGVLGLFGSLLIFSFTGEKSILVTPVLALFLVLSLRRSARGDTRPWLPGLLTVGLLAAPMLITRFWPDSALDVLVTRRIGLVPGLLTARYVEWVEMEGFTWFSQSWLKPFSISEESRLALGPRVGEWLDPGGALNANANIWADGYASAGLLGVLIVSVLLGLTLRFFDKVAMARDPVISAATLGMVTKSFTDGYFHNGLLTGGVIFGAALILASPLISGMQVRDGLPSTSPRDLKRREGSGLSPAEGPARGHRARGS